MSGETFGEYIGHRANLIEQYLSEHLCGQSNRLRQAMRYSALAGGKKLRGVLCLATAESVQPQIFQTLLPAAAALEAVHSMSLIHDDLPCMDDDDFRRGKPSCHQYFDEATALLAGDALLIEGFALCLQSIEIEPLRQLQMLRELALASGAHGMTAGQMLDLEAEGQSALGLEDLQRIHKLKTGALIRASVRIGALGAGASDAQLQALSQFAEAIGLAFQMIDDVLDLEGSFDELGKTPGKDIDQGKVTYPLLMGVDESRKQAFILVERAKQSLDSAGIEGMRLCEIADFIVTRQA